MLCIRFAALIFVKSVVLSKQTKIISFNFNLNAISAAEISLGENRLIDTMHLLTN